jgi:hypothetical protein
MTLSGSAQQSQDPRPRETPTFRGAINAVRVDVIVTDGDDRPVMDLTEADFELYEDGALRARVEPSGSRRLPDRDSARARQRGPIPDSHQSSRVAIQPPRVPAPMGARS